MKITAIRAHAVLLKVELDITSPAKTLSHQACVVENGIWTSRVSSHIALKDVASYITEHLSLIHI